MWVEPSVAVSELVVVQRLFAELVLDGVVGKVTFRGFMYGNIRLNGRGCNFNHDVFFHYSSASRFSVSCTCMHRHEYSARFTCSIVS